MKKTILLLIATFFILNSNKALAVQKEPSAEQRACVKNSLTTRDTTIKDAFTEFLSTLNNAYTARTSTINNAWDIATSSQRVITIKQATKDYKTIKTNAKNKFNKIKKDAWKKFNDEIRLKCSNNKFRFVSPDTILETEDNL